MQGAAARWVTQVPGTCCGERRRRGRAGAGGARRGGGPTRPLSGAPATGAPVVPRPFISLEFARRGMRPPAQASSAAPAPSPRRTRPPRTAPCPAGTPGRTPGTGPCPWRCRGPSPWGSRRPPPAARGGRGARGGGRGQGPARGPRVRRGDHAARCLAATSTSSSTPTRSTPTPRSTWTSSCAPSTRCASGCPGRGPSCRRARGGRPGADRADYQGGGAACPDLSFLGPHQDPMFAAGGGTRGRRTTQTEQKWRDEICFRVVKLTSDWLSLTVSRNRA